MKSVNFITFVLGAAFAAVALAAFAWLDVTGLKEIVVGIFAALSLSSFLHSPPASDAPWEGAFAPSYAQKGDIGRVTIVTSVGNRIVSIRGIPLDYSSASGRLSRIVLEKPEICDPTPANPFDGDWRMVGDRLTVDLDPQTASLVKIDFYH
jgi:hypothetical protein